MDKRNWIELSQDADTGIESIRAHFQGHAYDPHWLERELLALFEHAPTPMENGFLILARSSVHGTTSILKLPPNSKPKMRA